MTIDEFEKQVKDWYLENGINLSETWFHVKTKGEWKKKTVLLTNKIPRISHKGIFVAVGDSAETYEECFNNILRVLGYWEINKTKDENKECIETFCKADYVRY